MIRIPLAAFLLFLTFLSEPAWADIYSWVDNQGIQHYTTRFESIPEPYRSDAQTLSLPPSPPPPQELQSPPVTNSAIRISFSSGSPILVTAKINGAGPINLILDTGADRTMVRAPVVSGLGISTESSSSVLIRGVTGPSYATAVWINSLEVGEAKVGPLLIIAYETDLKGADGLLGRDFLANFNVTIDPREQVVTLTPN
jgi:predicted aspartyl protease